MQTVFPRRARHPLQGLGLLALSTYAFLVVALLVSLLLVLAPQPLPILSFISGSFSVGSRADFDANPQQRFAPLRPITQTDPSQK